MVFNTKFSPLKYRDINASHIGGNSQTVGRERPNALLLSDPTNARLKFPFPSQETSANCCPIATSPTNSQALPLLRRMQTTSFSKLIIEQVTYLSNNVHDVTWDLKMKITHENYITGILKHKKAKSSLKLGKYILNGETSTYSLISVNVLQNGRKWNFWRAILSFWLLRR